MFKKEPSQSQSISGSQISGAQVQLGQAEGDLTQMQQGNQAMIRQEMSIEEILQRLGDIETLIRASTLSELSKGKAIAHLDTAKEAVQQPEPDKPETAKGLKRMGDTLKTANETADEGKKLLERIQPLLAPIATWLGIAVNVLGF